MQLKAQATFERDTGIPEDRTVATFWIHGDTPPTTLGALYTDIVNRIQSFYNDTHRDPIVPAATLQPLYTHLSPLLQPTVTVKIYDQSQFPPRVPVHTDSFQLEGFDVAPLPEEVACCVSFSGNPVSGINPARLRGRMFFGPLGTTALETLSGRSRPSEQLRRKLVSAYATLVDFANVGGAPSDHNFKGHGSVGNLYFTVTQVWCDDAFDTQRKRGPDPQSRIRVLIANW